MTNTNNMQIKKDLAGKAMTINRHFKGSPEKVWAAWTESDILDQWWAPKPWQAETKHMDFKVGGHWLYAMVGPAGERHWARMDYSDITPKTSFTSTDYFCDEEGNKNNEMPTMTWETTFSASGDGTDVHVHITFPTTADLEKIVEMGFEEGFTAGLNNLDEYLSSNSR